MRVNIYSQELTGETCAALTQSGTGRVYAGARMMLHSTHHLHHDDNDDDRSAVTFWFPRSPERREELAQAFERMAEMARTCPLENEGETYAEMMQRFAAGEDI